MAFTRELIGELGLPAYRFSATCPCGGDRSITYEVQAPAGSKRSYSVTLTVTSAGGGTWTRCRS